MLIVVLVIGLAHFNTKNRFKAQFFINLHQTASTFILNSHHSLAVNRSSDLQQESCLEQYSAKGAESAFARSP